MKNVHEMTDQELMNYKNEQMTALQQEYNPFLKDHGKIDEQREAALDALHEIRVEWWRRGVGAPAEEKRANFERWLARGREQLAAAMASGNPAFIYAKRQVVRENEDRLSWIDGKLA